MSWQADTGRQIPLSAWRTLPSDMMDFLNSRPEAAEAGLEERSKMTAVKIIFAVLICVPLAVVCYHFLKKLVDELGRK